MATEKKRNLKAGAWIAAAIALIALAAVTARAGFLDGLFRKSPAES
ncbi:MAG: hypothetical protein HZB63_01965, partial [Deltaproteobacteria bacterium]|nr:hypothetical protein [Deltaproteobacteria bacterium]